MTSVETNNELTQPGPTTIRAERKHPEAFHFQVNLRAIIELLSNHLYSGPQVFIRELLQNCVDAIRARQQGRLLFRLRSLQVIGAKACCRRVGHLRFHAAQLWLSNCDTWHLPRLSGVSLALVPSGAHIVVWIVASLSWQ